MTKTFLVTIALSVLILFPPEHNQVYGEADPTKVYRNVLGQLDNWHHYERGLKQIEAKNFKYAEREFNYYFRHADWHRHMFGIAYFGRGLMFEAFGNDASAIKEYRMAIKNDLHPTVKISFKTYLNMGTIYMRNKAYQDAINAYSKAVESSPKKGLAHYYLGLAYLKAGEYEKAEQESEEAKILGITFTALSDKLSKIKNNSSKSRKTIKTNQTDTID